MIKKATKKKSHSMFKGPPDEKDKKELSYELAKVLYNTPVYKQWREYVFSRDGHRCQMCGQRGAQLEAHHLKPKRIFPELVLDKDNGITLCFNCHRVIVSNQEDKFAYIFKRIVLLNKRLYEEREVKIDARIQ